MRKNIYACIALAAVAVSSVSCTWNYLAINSHPYGITDKEIERDAYNVRAALVGIADGVISPDIITTQYTECLLGGPMAGYMASGNARWDNTIDNYNPLDNWTNVLMQSDRIIPVIYTNWNMLRRLTDDSVILAVSDIIKVAAMHRITDTYGPIPYSMIGYSGKIQVPYDSQEAVYSKMFEELDAAIDILTAKRDVNFSAASDAIYGGQTEKWIKFANSLKLRLALRVSYSAPELARKMAESAVSHNIGCFASNDDNAIYTTFGSEGNPMNIAVKYNMTAHDDGSTCLTGGDSHAAADIICYMNGYSDPRRAAYFTKSEWEGRDYVGLRHGIVIPEHSIVGHKFSGVNIGPNDPVVWMNASEVAFLKAEATAVFGWDMGGSAREFYEQGVRLSFDQWGAGPADSYLADNESLPEFYSDPSGSNDYPVLLSGITVAWDDAATVEQKQERIMIQKWIANWLLGNESWADIRRTGYPHIIPATDKGNKSGGIVKSSEGARRMPYPSEEYVNNAENVAAAVNNLLGGEDNMATRLWFDCKNR